MFLYLIISISGAYVNSSRFNIIVQFSISTAATVFC